MIIVVVVVLVMMVVQLPTNRQNMAMTAKSE